MSGGFPTGLDEDDVFEIVRARVLESMEQSRAALFRTGTATANGPGVNGNIEFSTGADDIVGPGVTRQGPLLRLGEGTWALEAITRPGNYADAAAFLTMRWFNVSANGFIGAQSICYANGSTSAFTHQPTFAAQLTVPAGATRDVVPRVSSAGTSWTLSEGRSFVAVRRLR